MTYSRKAILSNVGFVAVAFIIALFVGNYKAFGVAIFTYSYIFAFLANVVLYIRALVLKNKEAGRIHLIAFVAYILLAVPALFLFILFMGGIC